ncbi:MAG: hypothetical protein OEY19_04645 [Gammaproteobacteria bacterium]|nr:hypothetical protein [Gammaproteobacteria bacterium]MDH5630411.1 hypothetical protein [Gammaproteobacteria bacterium]
MKKSLTKVSSVAVLTAALTVMPTISQANHSWGTYHWASTVSPFTLTVVNSTEAHWDSYVTQAVADWSASSKLDMVEVEGSTNKRTRRQCNAPTGQIRICNDTYGQTGWLGIAGINIDTNGHITRGYTKMNDTYFDTAFYDQPDWRQSVTCQELGHDIGLGHQDENFNNQSLFSCMDYQNPPYEYPNAHDYEQLEIIYAHTDSYNTVDTSSGSTAPSKGKSGSNTPAGWGISMGRRGNVEYFIRQDEDGSRWITSVRWVDGYDGH